MEFSARMSVQGDGRYLCVLLLLLLPIRRLGRFTYIHIIVLLYYVYTCYIFIVFNSTSVYNTHKQHNKHDIILLYSLRDLYTYNSMVDVLQLGFRLTNNYIFIYININCSNCTPIYMHYNVVMCNNVYYYFHLRQDNATNNTIKQKLFSVVDFLDFLLFSLV